MAELVGPRAELGAKKERMKSVLGFTGNIFACTTIVFVLKVLMGRSGLGFHYATTLSALHFLSAGVTVLLTQGKGSGKGGKLPLKDLLMFTVVADASIITLNLSLLLNPVSTYQIAKLLVIPFVCLVERFFFGSVFTRPVMATIVTVIFGVGIVTVEEISFDGTPLGLLIAACSVVASGTQQILVRSLQQAHGLSSNELLGYVAPAQAASLLLLGPAMDKLVTSDWVWSYPWNIQAINLILLSCALAVGVNVTQFLCLGRFSAVTFQVLGHAKTILVLLGSWLFLGDQFSAKKLAGMVLAVLGMVLYGKFSMAAKPAPAHAPAKPAPLSPEERKLLIGEGRGLPVRATATTLPVVVEEPHEGQPSSPSSPAA